MSVDEELREGVLESCIPTRAEFYGCGCYLRYMLVVPVVRCVSLGGGIENRDC